MKSVKIVCAVVIFLLTIQISGCEGNYKGSETGWNLEYTVLGETKIPEEFLSQIEEKKAEKFELTYRDNEYLYIARGYGQKETGGYSISVVQMYAENKAIYFETKLIEPSENETVSNQQNFPYIVVKTELCDMPVVFK